jgi:hypothetical protein
MELTALHFTRDKMVQKWFHAKTQRRKVQDIDNQ